MKLYFAPRTRATRPRWLLEELEVPYQLVKVEPGVQNVPALVDGDVRMSEASAICLIYLADRFPQKELAPSPGTADRGHYYQWMSFAEGSLEPLVMEFHRLAQLSPPGTPPTGLRERLDPVLKAIDVELNGRENLVAGRFTAADLLLSAILHLASTLKLLDDHPRLFEYAIHHTRRPACRKAVS